MSDAIIWLPKHAVLYDVHFTPSSLQAVMQQVEKALMKLGAGRPNKPAPAIVDVVHV